MNELSNFLFVKKISLIKIRFLMTSDSDKHKYY